MPQFKPWIIKDHLLISAVDLPSAQIGFFFFFLYYLKKSITMDNLWSTGFYMTTYNSQLGQCAQKFRNSHRHLDMALPLAIN